MNDNFLLPTFASGWSLGDAGYEALRTSLRELSPRTLVEFGSGVSSLHLSHDFPTTNIWSRENVAEFAAATRAKVQELGHSKRVNVATCPLTWQVYGGALFLSYSTGPLPVEADAILIDGPPYWTRRGREACLYQAHSVLRIGGRVYLDDYRRPSEQRTVRNWLEAFAGAFVVHQVLETPHRICVLEKVAESSNPRPSARRATDSAWSNLLYLSSKIRGKLPK